MTPSCTFDDSDFRARSLVCALALTCAAFFILPVSIALSSADDSSEKLIRVYSYSDGEQSGKADGGSADGNKAEIPANAAEHVAVNVAPTADFSKISVNVPSIHWGGANFGIAGFGAAEGGDGGAFEIATFEISELDNIPRLLNRVSVKYPPQLLRRGIEGRVELNVMIDENGDIEVFSVAKSSNAEFEAAAIQAASKMKYEAPTKNGQPARVAFVLPIPFTIIKGK